MAGTTFSDYLGLKHYKKAKNKYFIHLRLANRPQSFSSYRTISHAGNSGYQLANLKCMKYFILFAFLYCFRPK